MSKDNDGLTALVRHPRLRAAAKRARKAAKRAEDAELTADGRAYVWRSASWLGAETPRGLWDRVEAYWRGYYDGLDCEPRWRQRLIHRRSLPWVDSPWWEMDGAQWRKAELQTVRMNRRMRRGAR